ncbi:GNAT family N-acetyltransferase [archaeon]|nr:GNAT family N-acetyltransferase [archaeon]MBT3577355.1 GNAT family N-acetyltransferase [archaeon]MBT6820402.1 GNAT family N-acetyltransferase [archaeon]MBT6956173.1 GNAT family N-acetyltransferase [archaeon]MBT7025216.1 GNAT family N-acetyltransferase [archaeon]
MEIRKATIADLKDIQGLCSLLCEKEHNEYDGLMDLDWAFSEKGEKYLMEAITKTTDYVFVAVDDGKIVGYLSGGIVTGEGYRNLPKMADLANFFILEDYRSKGLGRMFYESAVSWAKENDAKRLRVEVSPGNDKGVNFYKKMGFEEFTLTLERELE